MHDFKIFIAALITFHTSEFSFAAYYHPTDLSRKCAPLLTFPRPMIMPWLLSYPYIVAMTFACIEYGIEQHFLPVFHSQAASVIGLGMVIAGEVIRKTGMLTAQHNFTHDIKVEKADRHVLVTSGIYRWMRHPGYGGWLLWSVGTQVLLGNPICTCVFAFTSWRFFQQRIEWEDSILLRFFGDDFLRYKQRISSGIPFIR